jgi:MerR family transcriptional regulator, light-induced transcriptional regulator
MLCPGHFIDNRMTEKVCSCMTMKEARYPIGAVARMTGLGLDRLRVWERRYEAVVPERGPRGRLYTAGHVERLSLLRDAVERGHAIGEATKLDNARLRELLESPVPAPAADRSLLGPALDAIERLDCAAADRYLSRMAALLEPRAVVHDIALPLVRIVGKGWEEGRFSVSQEHMVSALLRNLLGSLVRLYAPHDQSPSLLMATPAGEWHEFGILSAALLAAGSGMGVIYLGANLPASEIVEAARRTAAAVIVLGIAESKPPRSLVTEVGRISRVLPSEIELWVGGPAETLDCLLLADAVKLASFDDFENQVRRLGGRSAQA